MVPFSGKITFLNLLKALQHILIICHIDCQNHLFDKWRGYFNHILEVNFSIDVQEK